MTDCAKTRELLSPYLEGELEPAEGRDVGSHLDGCADCRAELELLRLAVGALREMPELPAPAGILRGVREGLEPPTWRERVKAILFPGPARRLPLGALASVLLAFGIFLIYDHYPELGRTPVVTPPVEKRKTQVEESPPPPTSYDSVQQPPATEPEPGSALEPAAVSMMEVEKVPAGKKDRLAAGTADRDGEPAVIAGAVEDAEATAPSDDRAAVAEYRQVVETAPVGPPPGPAPQPVRPSRTSPPPRPLPAPEPVTPPPTQITSREKEEPATAQTAWNRPQPAPKTLRKRSAAKPVPAEGLSSFAAPLDEARSKSIPLRPELGETFMTPFADHPASRVRAGAPAGEERPNGYEGLTEVLTVVSLNGGEVERLRESLRMSGGKLLEMRTLDAFTSRQLALPHQESIPPAQVISRGWQIRAAVPHRSVEEFVSAIGRDASLKLLHRSTAPASWSRERGLQNIEINIVR
jgi:hypothetical protein